MHFKRNDNDSELKSSPRQELALQLPGDSGSSGVRSIENIETKTTEFVYIT